MDNFFALIIGVGGADIPETVKDAEAIRDVLISKGAYNPNNTFFLTEHKSTKDDIINAFDEIIKKSEETPDSTVFIYYSGHGQRFTKASGKKFDYYLITLGADKNDKEKTMLNGNIFSEKVEKIKANRILVMLDCCYAGGMKNDGLKIKGEEEVVYSNRALQEKLKSGKGRVFVSSCDDNETSVILPKSKNSLFTEVALEVLNGLFSQNREYVSVLDLIYHVLNEVPNRIKPYNHNQNPILTEAKNLNHKYYVCKNGESKQGSSSIEINLEHLNITKDEETLDVVNIDDLAIEDKTAVDSFIKKINIKESDIQAEFKIDLINNIGGVRNLKNVNKKFRSINFNKVHSMQSIDVENALNTVNEQIDVEAKLQFIKNYKYKI
jgi:hypothetical protein